MKKRSTTIQLYVSAIKAVLGDVGVILQEDKCLLTSLMRACRLKNNTIQCKLPIKKDLYAAIVNKCEDLLETGHQFYLSCLYKAIFTAGYYGMMRIGEITSGDHPVKAIDVHVALNKRKMLFILRTSKTHNLSDKPQLIKICGSVSQFRGNCPFEIMNSYIKVRPKCVDVVNEPFFVFLDRSPVRPLHARDMLKLILKKLSLNSDLYSFHGLHTGRATNLHDWGVSVETIKKLGCWKSNIIYTYLR